MAHVYCYVLLPMHTVTTAHDTTFVGIGDSNPGNNDVTNPLEEDTTGGVNIYDDVLFEGKCIHM